MQEDEYAGRVPTEGAARLALLRECFSRRYGYLLARLGNDVAHTKMKLAGLDILLSEYGRAEDRDLAAITVMS